MTRVQMSLVVGIGVVVAAALAAGALLILRRKPTAPCGRGVDRGGVAVAEVARILERFGPRGSHGADAEGAEVFAGPFGVHVGPDGRLYVSDDLSHRVLIFDAGGKLERTLGRQGQGPGEVAWVDAVWAAADGALYVADTGNHRVQVWDREGRFVREIGRRGGLFARGLQNPRDVALDPAGRVWVADAGGDCVQVFDVEGRLLRRIGRSGGGHGELSGPVQLALAPGGLLYVSDSRNHRIQVFQEDGAFVRCFGDQGPRRLVAPHGLAFGPEGHLYVADHASHRVHVLEPDSGDLVGTIGDEGSGPGQLKHPTDLCFSQDGAVLHVVDAGNHRVQSWRTPTWDAR